MTNNPAYRQNWILDRLKANPIESYNDMFTNYLQNFTNSRQTFTKDWLKANARFSTYQETINNAKLEESIKIEKEAVKRNILSKNDGLEILTEIAQGKAKKVEGEIFMPSFNERTNAIKTIASLEGWEAPKQIEDVTKKEPTEITFKVIHDKPLDPPS